MYNNIHDLVETRQWANGFGDREHYLWPKCDQGAWFGPRYDWDRGMGQDIFKRVKQYNTVVTAGANCGLHTRAYASKFSRVYAFEPHWLNFYCLVNNCPEANVFKFNCALGEEPGISMLSDGHDDNMGCYHLNGDRGTYPIQIITIDSLRLNACDLIQLDVEGYEPQVLRGAEQTISQFHPVVMVEVDSAEVQFFLTSLGYVADDASVKDRIYYYE